MYAFYLLKGWSRVKTIVNHCEIAQKQKNIVWQKKHLITSKQTRLGGTFILKTCTVKDIYTI